MFRLSQLIEKLERKYERRYRRFLSRHKNNIWRLGTLGGLGLYFYAMFVNSIRIGINSTFAGYGSEPVKSIVEWNPFKNLLALFSSTGFGVTFIIALMTMLVNKKGYHILSGYKYDKDKRGFDVLPDGAHGTSGFMKHSEMGEVLDYGKVSTLSGTILGKIKEDVYDDDRYADYISPKSNN